MFKVSIIYPMYNVEKYIRNSLSSILNQTYANFELIAINDGSTDNTMNAFYETIYSYNKLPDFKVITKNNGGLSDARNKGLENATGKWVVFIDSDDVIHPEYLNTLVTDSLNNNSDLSIGYYKKVIYEELFIFDHIEKGNIIEKKKLMHLMLSRNKFDAYCGSFLIDRELLMINDIKFNPKVRFSVDQAFMWKVVDVSKKITLNYSKLYNYFLREGSIMTSSKIDQIISGVSHYTNVINSLEYLPFNKKVLINRWKIGIMHSSAKLCNYSDYMSIKNNIDFRCIESIRIPILKIRILSFIGLISNKLLYKIFKKY
ncbi:glycosyltransferase family 2 protein [Acholeplasma laidlawii]|uniref:glycosyltransferase family 2 protein n=1 Tax=Acholeplasma laidlawii TaxID=2148 RepID=UPI0021F6F958|nr:glycosyltransferase family 2 protein [Acholeplasma laidlawii]